MSVARTITYAGLRYLDRTAALETGEVIPHGARFELRFTQTAEEAFAALQADEVDCAEIPLARILEARFADEYVALPVFPNRGFVSRLLFAPEELDAWEDLVGKRIGVPTEDSTVATWARVVADLPGVQWFAIPAADLAVAVGHGSLDLAFIPHAAPRDGLVRALSAEAVRAVEGAELFPIHSVVALRASVYREARWLAVSLMDAFIEAKEEGMKRHRYFGALSVGLPWLMAQLEEMDGSFGGDAYRYGLGPNLSALERFAASHASGSDVTRLFAPETQLLPGVPDTTFYAVPLSNI